MKRFHYKFPLAYKLLFLLPLLASLLFVSTVAPSVGESSSFFSEGLANKGQGTLSIETHPTGAEIFLDGERVGKSPLTLAKVDSGPHTVRLLKAGYPVRQEAIHIQNATEKKLHLTMIASGPAVIDVRSVPEPAQWWLNGQLKGITPHLVDKIPAGSYQVKITAPGYQDWNQDLQINKGELIQVRAELVAKEYHLTILTEPKNAKISFQDSDQAYTPGMLVKPGQYFFWISAPGYESKKGRVTLIDRDWIGHLRLQKSVEAKLTAAMPPPFSSLAAVALPSKPVVPVKQSGSNRPKPVPAMTLQGSSSLPTLMQEAEIDTKEARLFAPAGRNAAEKYRRILDVQPDSIQAKKGLEHLKRLSESAYLIFVRIFPVTEQQKAERFLARIQELNLPGFLLPVTINGVAHFRVCAGLFEGRPQAIDGLKRIKKQLGVQDGILRRYRSSLHEG
ncbi:MAG: PEGA domain-containing protein [Magnetococcales bacterium]|nr:PEGA domain-containing protein [Magnetococcales bacterium]